MAGNTSKTYVIDASYILTYLLPDENSTSVDELFVRYQKKEVHFVAPPLLQLEVLGGLRSAVLRKRLKEADALELAQKFLDLDIEFREIPYLDVLKLSFETSLTVYDSTYLWISKDIHIPILTQDSQLLIESESIV